MNDLPMCVEFAGLTLLRFDASAVHSAWRIERREDEAADASGNESECDLQNSSRAKI